MTIRNLAARGFVTPAEVPRTEPGRRCLAFVLDRAFLHPFKVLIYTLARSGSFLDLPILIFTQDPTVRDDPVVQALADRQIFVTDADIRQFSVVSGEKIDRKHHRKWIAKYTFLKWLIFDDHDVGETLFIDADILCLRKADAIFDEPRGRDLGICPRMMPSLYQTEDEAPRPPEDIAPRLHAMARGEIPADHVRMNSGVMILAERCLDPAFRRRLLELATTNALGSEQAYITMLFAEDDGYEADFLPPAYNFTNNALSKVSTTDQLALLNRIVFLHFTGGKKPWTWPLTPSATLGHMLWRRFEAEAAAESDLIRGQRSWISARLRGG